MGGVLDVPGLLVHLGEGRVHALVLHPGLAVLLWDGLLRRRAPLGLAVHRGREHLERGPGEKNDD